jgi:Tfp pilus assembly protein FimT
MESDQKTLKAQMNDFEKEHSNKVLLLNNEINALQKHLEVSAKNRSNCCQLDSQVILISLGTRVKVCKSRGLDREWHKIIK